MTSRKLVGQRFAVQESARVLRSSSSLGASFSVIAITALGSPRRNGRARARRTRRQHGEEVDVVCNAAAAWLFKARSQQAAMVRAAQQTLEVLDIFPARHAPDPFCDRNTTLYDFLDACVLLLHNCPNLSSQNRNGHRTRCRCANRWEVKSLIRLRTWNGSQSSAPSWWQLCFAQSYSQMAS